MRLLILILKNKNENISINHKLSFPTYTYVNYKL